MNTEQTFELPELSLDQAQTLLGQNDIHLKLLKQVFEVSIVVRDQQLIVLNTSLEIAQKVYAAFLQIITQLKSTSQIDERDIIYIAKSILEDRSDHLSKLKNTLIGRSFTGKPIYAKTTGQNRFIEALKNYELVFSIGPAGTGKTYLSVVYAVACLKKGDVKKIILTRPVVEAGENLGFLPGDLKEKIDPYLRPLYDALNDLLGLEQVDKMIEKGIIEIAPLAYMRGRTFDDAYVILDEAQNTTKTQMLMFLTRMGFHTRLVVTGDETQVDLKQSSGLAHARKILSNITEIKFVELDRSDIVRHPLVQKIIESYSIEDSSSTQK